MHDYISRNSRVQASFFQQHASLAPAIHSDVDRVPVAQTLRQASPFVAIFSNIQNSVDALKIIQANIPALARKANITELDFIKGQRYNLFRNPENLTKNGKQQLTALLEANAVSTISRNNGAFTPMDNSKVPPCSAWGYLGIWQSLESAAQCPHLAQYADQPVTMLHPDSYRFACWNVEPFKIAGEFHFEFHCGDTLRQLPHAGF